MEGTGGQLLIPGHPNPAMYKTNEAYRNHVDKNGSTSMSLGSECVLIMALNFIHCKNVTVLDKKEIAKRKFRSSVFKNPKGVFTEFHELEIRGMSKIINDAQNSGPGISFKKALHICAGHFKNYTQEKPLFGKAVGRYWWEDHVRGTGPRKIDKHYNVSP